MPRSGAIALWDVDVPYLTIVCDRCKRRGRYSGRSLRRNHGDDALTHLLPVRGLRQARLEIRQTNACRRGREFPESDAMSHSRPHQLSGIRQIPYPFDEEPAKLEPCVFRALRIIQANLRRPLPSLQTISTLKSPCLPTKHITRGPRRTSACNPPYFQTDAMPIRIRPAATAFFVDRENVMLRS